MGGERRSGGREHLGWGGAARATGRRSGEGDGREDEARRTAVVETLGGRSLASGVGLGVGRSIDGDLVARERGSKEIARGKLTNGAPDLGAPLEFFFAMAHPAAVCH